MKTSSATRLRHLAAPLTLALATLMTHQAGASTLGPVDWIWLKDSERDGTGDVVNAYRGGFAILNVADFAEERSAAEFDLSAISGPVRSAVFRTGTPVLFTGFDPVDAALFGYPADGTAELADWNSGLTHLGTGPVVDRRPFEMDVTAYLNEQIAAGQLTLGFSLRQITVTPMGGRKFWNSPYLEIASWAPVADAGADQALECAGSTTPVVLDGSASSDADDTVLSFRWLDASGAEVSTDAVASLGLSQGTHTFTLVVTDPSGESSQDTVEVDIQDSTGPILQCPPPQLAVATNASGAVVHFEAATAFDSCSEGGVQVIYSHASGSLFPPGTTEVVIQAFDGAGNGTACTFEVQVAYEWSGVLSPLDAAGGSVVNVGRTVPVKFRLAGASAGIHELAATLSYAKITGTTVGPWIAASSNSSATQGNQFRYESRGDEYHFNWTTRGLTAGSYLLSIDLGDGVPRTLPVSLR